MMKKRNSVFFVGSVDAQRFEALQNHTGKILLLPNPSRISAHPVDEFVSSSTANTSGSAATLSEVPYALRSAFASSSKRDTFPAKPCVALDT